MAADGSPSFGPGVAAAQRVACTSQAARRDCARAMQASRAVSSMARQDRMSSMVRPQPVQTWSSSSLHRLRQGLATVPAWGRGVAAGGEDVEEGEDMVGIVAEPSCLRATRRFTGFIRNR